jgi:hypothetical protein
MVASLLFFSRVSACQKGKMNAYLPKYPRNLLTPLGKAPKMVEEVTAKEDWLESDLVL